MSEYVYNKTGMAITIHEADPQFYADMHTVNTFREKAFSEEEAMQVAVARAKIRQAQMPGLIGEYAISESLSFGDKAPRAHAIMAHDYKLGATDLVYVGCDGLQFAQTGELFGSKSTAEQRAVKESSRTYGLHRDAWQIAVFGSVEPLRYAREQRLAMIIGLESSCLEPILSHTRAGALLWELAAGETLETAARTVYVDSHPTRLGMLA